MAYETCVRGGATVDVRARYGEAEPRSGEASLWLVPLRSTRLPVGGCLRACSDPPSSDPSMKRGPRCTDYLSVHVEVNLRSTSSLL